MSVLVEAAVPLVQDNAANTAQTQQQSSLTGALQGKRSCTGEKGNTKRVYELIINLSPQQQQKKDSD